MDSPSTVTCTINPNHIYTGDQPSVSCAVLCQSANFNCLANKRHSQKANDCYLQLGEEKQQTTGYSTFIGIHFIRLTFPFKEGHGHGINAVTKQNSSGEKGVRQNVYKPSDAKTQRQETKRKLEGKEKKVNGKQTSKEKTPMGGSAVKTGRKRKDNPFKNRDEHEKNTVTKQHVAGKEVVERKTEPKKTKRKQEVIDSIKIKRGDEAHLLGQEMHISIRDKHKLTLEMDKCPLLRIGFQTHEEGNNIEITFRRRQNIICDYSSGETKRFSGRLWGQIQPSPFWLMWDEYNVSVGRGLDVQIQRIVNHRRKQTGHIITDIYVKVMKWEAGQNMVTLKLREEKKKEGDSTLNDHMQRFKKKSTKKGRKAESRKRKYVKNRGEKKSNWKEKKVQKKKSVLKHKKQNHGRQDSGKTKWFKMKEKTYYNFERDFNIIIKPTSHLVLEMDDCKKFGLKFQTGKISINIHIGIKKTFVYYNTESTTETKRFFKNWITGVKRYVFWLKWDSRYLSVGKGKDIMRHEHVRSEKLTRRVTAIEVKIWKMKTKDQKVVSMRQHLT